MDFESKIDSFDEWLNETIDHENQTRTFRLSGLISSTKLFVKETPLHYFIGIGALAFSPFVFYWLIQQHAGTPSYFRINWLVVFIFYAAWRKFKYVIQALNRQGKLTADLYTALASATITFFAGFIFLFQLHWSLIWPFFIICGSLFKLFGRATLENQETSSDTVPSSLYPRSPSPSASNAVTTIPAPNTQ